MLRPATPLSVLLLVSFILLLISTLSTPVVKSIALARYKDVNFGVFGWCRDDGTCSGVEVGWNVRKALPNDTDADGAFGLSATKRHSLSSLLIVHPVAAFCNLVVLALALAAHFHSPSHSARYLLGLLIALLPTLLVTLLAFLVDILLFIPHLQWAGWIVLASTILVTASGVVTCAMRRTLVSRKARKKRIAENAEMSGENFYARQAAESKLPAIATEFKSPMVNGAPGADTLPSFATFNGASRTSQERRTPGLPPNGPASAVSPMDSSDRFYGNRSRSTSRHRTGDVSTPFLANTPQSDEPPPVPYLPRGGIGPPRGRGNYPPRGAMSARGGFNRGPPPVGYPRGGGFPGRDAGRGRGGFGPSPGPLLMGAPVPSNGANRGPPPPGYPPQGRRVAQNAQDPNGPSGPPMNSAGAEAYSPSEYGPEAHAGFGPYGARAQSPAQRRASPFGARSHSPGHGERPPSPQPNVPPVPMGATYRSVRTESSALGYDTELQGMVNLQQNHPPMPSPPMAHQEYIPPRAGWTTDGPPPVATSLPRAHRVGSAGSDYMEDVDPRFAEPVPTELPATNFERNNTLPRALAAGPQQFDPSPEREIPPLLPSHSFEELPGSRSPVESETSNFTSVSQRQINPDWRPGYGGDFGNFEPMRRHQEQRKQDMLFNGNPDFELSVGGPPGRAARGGFAGRGGFNRGGPALGRGGLPRRPLPPSALNEMTGDGRYPAPVSPTGPGSNGGVMREI